MKSGHLLKVESTIFFLILFAIGCMGPSSRKIQRAQQEAIGMNARIQQYNSEEEMKCEQLALEHSERIYKKDFALVFDAVTMAMAKEQCPVGSMERASGFISASGFLVRGEEIQAIFDKRAKDFDEINAEIWRRYGFDHYPRACPNFVNSY